MSENKLKSSLLEKYSLKSSNISSQKLESSLLLSKSLSLKTFELKQKSTQLLTDPTSSSLVDRKKKLNSTETTNVFELAKKPKVLETNVFNNSGLLNKPTILSNNSLTSTTSKISFLNLSNSSHSGSFNSTSSLLNKFTLQNNANFSSLNKVTQIEEVNIETYNSSKRPYFHLTSNESDYVENESLLLKDEFLKTDVLIDTINKEQKKYEEDLLKAKKLKKSNQSIFMENSLVIKNELTVIQRQKNILINAVSSSLLKQPNFKNLNDPTRKFLLNCSEPIIRVEPEFILKLALYTRQELNIRVTANFLLCLASNQEACRPYLLKYFKSSIVLPSDWIEVAEQYQLFMDSKLNFGALPSALRKAMVEKFSDFDKYQLAKYNKEKSRMAKNKNLKDVKHVKSKLKDTDGNELTGEKTLIEDKYIKMLQNNGLKINDRIHIECITNEKCNNLKFDIIKRDEVKNNDKNNLKPSKTRRGMPLKPPSEETNENNESVAVRINIDYTYKRITQKSFLNKAWSKRSEFINSPKDFEFYRGFDTQNFFIDITSKDFVFGFIKNEKDFVLSRYDHAKHNIELFKLNGLRISGVGLKLKDLKIVSKDLVQLDTQQSEENEQELKQRSFTLKQLIRQLHISKPVEHVMALIGKKYPLTFEEFMQSKLPGIFDSEKIGKRMKLPTPETWETQISLKGNKAHVWEQLIDNKKLPYMAMLRNLRNMIKTGISEKHHQWVIKKLQDEGAVIHSKQFPFRFFTAYEVLDELEEEFKKYIAWSVKNKSSESEIINPSNKHNKNKKNEKKQNTDMNYDEDILKRYKTALDNALKVATTYNISPIKGSTAIFLNLGQSMNYFLAGSAKSLGKKVTTLSDIAALMALMFKYSCEHSKLIIFNSSSIFTDIQLEQGTILDNMKSLTELKNLKPTQSVQGNYPYKSFHEILSLKEHYDNIIYLSNGINDVEYHKAFLRKYRAYVNKNMLFVNVNLSVAECNLVNDVHFDHENDISISGYSDSILRFVAERGNQGQLVHIENIDKAYDLPDIKQNPNKQEKVSFIKASKIERPEFKVYVPKIEWKNVKVFISSTFRDMHSERDILTKTVFPMLRAKLSPFLINVHEIDMRWGITESETKRNETLDLCLRQILDSQYFVSMLGERYGQVLNSYDCSQNIQWLNSYPIGASITELEIECQLRKTDENKYEKSFFYFRDGTFLKDVPDNLQEHFIDEFNSSRDKLAKLKSRILSEPYEIFNGYTCKWLKLEEQTNRVLLTDLDIFAHRVFNNLFNAIYNHNKDFVQTIELNEMIHQTNLNDAYANACAESFVGRKKLLDHFAKLLTGNQFIELAATSTESSKELINASNSLINIVLIEGESGSGKTSFLCHFMKNYAKNLMKHNFFHIVGSYENSEYVLLFLKRFCVKINSEYGFTNEFNEEELINTNDFEYLKLIFSKMLKKLSEKIINDKFFIILDGVDMLTDTNKNLDHSFSWLPENIPARISFIFTAKSSNSQIKSALSKISTSNIVGNNKIKIETFNIEPLDVLDKSEFIRLQLSKYNKHLDETPFNNQMKLLTTKRDSINPLYLTWACEELRQFNEFNTLNQKIKELPIKINLLVDYILKRLEITFDAKFTNAAFMFICCARDGLMEHELKKLMEVYFTIEKLNCMEIIEKCESVLDLKKDDLFSRIFNSNSSSEASTLKVYSFIESISLTFLKPRSNNLLNINSNKLIQTCLKEKYGNKLNKLNINLTNKIMALYYWNLIDENLKNEWNQNAVGQRPFIYLPYHLSISSINDLVMILSDLTFISTKCELGLALSLMDDFDLHQSYSKNNILINVSTPALSAITNKKVPSKSILDSKKFLDYKLFTNTNYHLLNKNPELIYQQAMNQPESSHVSVDLKALLENNSNKSGLLFEWINKAKDSDKFNLFPIKIEDVNEAICCVSISPNGENLACGTENCEIKLYSISTACLIKKLQGHSGRINQTCFIDEETLCSASSDGIASIWNVNDGYRIKVLDKHNSHTVSSCCGEPNGKSVITVGWDCTAKIWSKAGDFLGELKGHQKPINCVIFNPDGNLVATACWDSCIRIFNLYDRSRKAVLRGHNASVRAISFSNNGVYIASSSIDAEVKLWNSKNGSQIATLKSHAMPVNTLRFSPNSQFLVTGSSDCRTKVWSGSVGKMINVIRENDESKAQPVTSVCFNQKTGETIAVGYHSGEIRIYDLLGTGSLKAVHKSHSSSIKKIKFSNYGNYLITGADDGLVKVIDVSSYEKLTEVAELTGNTKSINALDINQFNTLIIGAEDCLLSVYTQLFENINLQSQDEENINIFEDTYPMETNTNKAEVKISHVPKIRLDSHKSPVTACSFNSEGDQFASSSKNGTFIVWSFNIHNLTVDQLFSIPNAHSDWITDLKWSNTSDFILTSSNDFTLKIWSSKDGSQKQHLIGHTSNIKSCSFQYGCAVSCSYDGSVKVWSHKGHEITTLIGHQKVVNGCDIWVKLKRKNKINKEDMKRDEDENMVVGDLWSDKVDEETWISKHKSAVLNKQDFEVDKFYLVTVSDDKTIRLWKPVEADYLINLENHNDKVNSVDLGKNNILATASSDKTINLWNMNEYFKNFTSGLHINTERLTRNHASEITFVCPTNSGAYILSGSKDGMVIIWKCVYEKSKLKEIKFVFEVQAHERSCNRICVIDENINNKINTIRFITSSDKDINPIKSWKYEEDLSKKTFENSSVIIIQDLKCSPNTYVLFVDIIKMLNQTFLISIESDMFRIIVKFFKFSNNTLTVHQSSGCLISYSGKATMINRIKIINGTLYITLLINEIIRIDLAEIIKKYQFYNLNDSTIKKSIILMEKTADEPIDLSLEGSKKNWFNSIDANDFSIFVGDHQGYLYTNEENCDKLSKVKSIHSDRITELICLKNNKQLERLISASQDGTIKIWSKNAHTQLGQYNTNSGITVLAEIPTMTYSGNVKYSNFIFGDKMGNLNLLRWYDE